MIRQDLHLLLSAIWFSIHTCDDNEIKIINEKTRQTVSYEYVSGKTS